MHREEEEKPNMAEGRGGKSGRAIRYPSLCISYRYIIHLSCPAGSCLFLDFFPPVFFTQMLTPVLSSLSVSIPIPTGVSFFKSVSP